MAKLGAFFRRLFTPTSSNDRTSSSWISEPQENILIMPPLSSSKLTTKTTRSCTVSPQPSPRSMMKKTTIDINNMNKTSNSNFLSSDNNKTNNRRLSVPIIVPTPTHHHPRYIATVVNKNTEEALLSSLQRLSFSALPTTIEHPHSSIHSLGPNSGSIPTSLLSRPDVRSASFNLTPSCSSLSNNLIKNLSPASGR